MVFLATSPSFEIIKVGIWNAIGQTVVWKRYAVSERMTDKGRILADRPIALLMTYCEYNVIKESYVTCIRV